MTASYAPGIPPAPVVIAHDSDPVQSDVAWSDPLALAADWLPAPGEATSTALACPASAASSAGRMRVTGRSGRLGTAAPSCGNDPQRFA